MVDVIVNAQRGASLTIDRTAGPIDIAGGFQFDSADASSVALTLQGIGSFLGTGSLIASEDLSVSFGSISGVAVQLDDGSDQVDLLTPLAVPIVVTAGAGRDDVIANVDPTSVGFLTLQGSAFDSLTLNGGTANDTIVVSPQQVRFDGLTVDYDRLGSITVNADGGANTLTADFRNGGAVPAGDPPPGVGLSFQGTLATNTMIVLCGAGEDAVSVASNFLTVSTPNGLYEMVFPSLATIELDPGAGNTVTIDKNSASEVAYNGDGVRLAALNIEDGARLTLTAHAANAYNTLVTDTLSIDGTGTLDITNNWMIVGDDSEAQLSDVQGWLVSGYGANGDWGGTGIVSSLATSGQQYATTIGYGLESSLGLSSFGGQTPTQDAVLVRYTYVGDVDLNGTVDNSDTSRIIAQGKYNNGSLAIWTDGDFNYDLFATNADISMLIASGNYLDGLSLGQ